MTNKHTVENLRSRSYIEGMWEAHNIIFKDVPDGAYFAAWEEALGDIELEVNKSECLDGIDLLLAHNILIFDEQGGKK